MLYIRMIWQWLLIGLGASIVLVLRPRVLIFLFLAVALGGTTYLYYDHPAIGLAVKTFVTKTLPKVGAKIVYVAHAIWPKIVASTAKGWTKKALLYLAIFGLTKQRKEWFVERKQLVVYVVKYYFFDVPWKRWCSYGKRTKIVVASGVLAVLASMVGVYVLYPLVFLPMALISEALLWVWGLIVRLLTKVGLGKLVMLVQSKVIAWLIRPFRKHLTILEWKIARRLVPLRRRVRARNANMARWIKEQKMKRAELRKQQRQAKEVEETE